MHTVQHHRLQYSFLLVSHLTWLSPCDRVKLITRLVIKANKNTKMPQSCNMLDFKGRGCQIMAVNDQGVKYKLQFSGCSFAKYLNSTTIFLWSNSFRVFSWQQQNLKVLSCRARLYFGTWASGLFCKFNWTRPRIKKTPCTLHLYINT